MYELLVRLPCMVGVYTGAAALRILEGLEDYVKLSSFIEQGNLFSSGNQLIRGAL